MQANIQTEEDKIIEGILSKFKHKFAVLSGKGGTGKTTVATNMAVSLGSDVQVLDC
ncbi:MAG: P-loop NTPase, partial [Candidatus Heimdallarchaeota archaeon]|nr:P-loop NTPase [Candidatus Heimdallarchaeota archaeon]MCK4954098.1 P-loop NTPase [Candidatus Heimdallarchaeota archaeon]